MASNYYKPCKELEMCEELIEKYWNSKQYDKCFEGHLPLAEQGYPLAECQIGYFYFEGLGIEKDLEKAFYWTHRAAEHGDRDGQFNLAWFYEEGYGVNIDLEKAEFWYKKAAMQNHDLAINKCKEMNINL
ncbi:MAG: sel1 repeat family protein [Erysipelotrichales bacterium]|nr:sel1 repeat family protein [Erysipelotrichales bacterium]